MSLFFICIFVMKGGGEEWVHQIGAADAPILFVKILVGPIELIKSGGCDVDLQNEVVISHKERSKMKRVAPVWCFKLDA